MKHSIGKISAVFAALALAGLTTAHAATTDATGATAPATAATLSPGQERVAARFASPFATMAGSTDNAVALATALRTGTPATLTYTAIVDGKTVTTTELFTPPTKPMGWGNVSHALALAQYSLTRAGITSPTSAELQAALVGGKITTADGKVVTLEGVLQQRASGMGWGQIARSEGTTMGAVDRGLKSTTVASTAVDPTTTKSTVTTAAGTSSTTRGKGVMTAGATSTATSGKGVTTANGSSTASAHGKGLTTAGGASATPHGSKGLTTAGGATSGSGVVTASGGHGGGSAARGVVTAGAGGTAPATDHGKGKGGG